MEETRWRRYYEALYEVATALGQSLEPEVVLQTLVRDVVKVLGLRAASIRLLRNGGLLEPVATEGLSPDYLHKGPVELSRSLVDREAIKGGPVQIADVSVDPRFEYPEEAKREGIVSAVFVALCARDVPIGVFRVYTGARHTFTPDEIQLLTALANLGALAISNARMYQVCVRDQQLTTEALWSFRLPDEWLRPRRR
jgi:signal transduction protein with GAF and PtsI domain